VGNISFLSSAEGAFKPQAIKVQKFCFTNFPPCFLPLIHNFNDFPPFYKVRSFVTKIKHPYQFFTYRLVCTTHTLICYGKSNHLKTTGCSLFTKLLHARRRRATGKSRSTISTNQYERGKYKFSLSLSLQYIVCLHPQLGQ
jgi:hypothetical protein